MTAKEYLEMALGGNMNVGTLTPFAIEEIMKQYVKYLTRQDIKKHSDYITILKDYRGDNDCKISDKESYQVDELIELHSEFVRTLKSYTKD